jgi:hypothetical protein
LRVFRVIALITLHLRDLVVVAKWAHHITGFTERQYVLGGHDGTRGQRAARPGLHCLQSTDGDRARGASLCLDGTGQAEAVSRVLEGSLPNSQLLLRKPCPRQFLSCLLKVVPNRMRSSCSAENCWRLARGRISGSGTWAWRSLSASVWVE